MTAPVLSNNISNGTEATVMEFVLPAEMGQEGHKVPTPNDGSIYVKTEKSQTVAVKKFSWKYTPEKGREQLNQLMEELKRDGLVAADAEMNSVDWKVA